MNILTPIQAALTTLNSNAELFMLEKARAENEELEHSTREARDVIIVYPDWKTSDEINQGSELVETTVYELTFKSFDEWDNSDADSLKSYNNESSMLIIDSMQILANSVFLWMSITEEFPEIRQKLSWKTTPRLRKGNGTMSGVDVKLTVISKGARICDYSKIN